MLRGYSFGGAVALRNQPYIPLYVQDFLTDEKLIECSASATGVYIRIMCVMHKSDEYGTILLRQKGYQNSSKVLDFAMKLLKYLPYDLSTIESALEELVLEGVLQIEGDKLLQKRMIKDNYISIVRKKAGAKGGFAKAKGLANSEYEIETETEIVSNKDEHSTKIDFDTFWDLYDKKVGDKTKLQKKWDKLTLEIQTKALEHITEYKTAQQDKQYRKNPDTYLNNKSWNDEIISKDQTQTIRVVTA